MLGELGMRIEGLRFRVNMGEAFRVQGLGFIYSILGSFRDNGK